MVQSQFQRAGRRGHAAIETALMAPWIFLLFVGVVDFGFYAYAAIATQHAARAAALYTSSSPDTAADSASACLFALGALEALPNMTGVTTCAGLPQQISPTQPVAASASSVTGIDGSPASAVTVTYQTVPLFPIPGLMGQMTITRTTQMRVQSP